MLFLLPVLILALAALTGMVLQLARPGFKNHWLVALSGSILAFAGVLFWNLRFPNSFSLPPWQPASVFNYTPTWLVDSVSFPYSIALTALAAAIILTSVVRNEKDPTPWVGTLSLTALGILAVSAGDPLTLILIWTAIDLAELVTMLRSTRGEKQSQDVVVAFAVRVVGTGFVIWASAVSASTLSWQGFDRITSDAGIYLLFASGLRLGILPLHLPYRQDSAIRRGFGTSLRLISASASLALLARIPTGGLEPAWGTFLLLAAALPALYAGWMWLRSSDEIVGRPFWVLGLGALALSSALRGSPNGSIGWGLTLILSGGLVFLYSSRQRTILWLPLLGLWGLSALPLSTTSISWFSDTGASLWLLLPYLPAQALLMAGFFRHLLHPGETSFESQERWARVLYPAGLGLLAVTSLALGLWGWEGALQVGFWWIAIPVVMLAVGVAILSHRKLRQPSGGITQWGDVFRLDLFYRFINFFVRLLERLAGLIARTLEGEGGIFWSILLLVLLLSLLSVGGG